MDLEIFKTDESAVEGTWVDIEFRGQIGKFRIARAGNPEFNRVYRQLRNAKRFSDNSSDEAELFNDDCLSKAFAETILLDTGEEITHKGEPVKYTSALGYELLSNPAYVELKNQIIQAAGDFEQFASFKLDEIVEKWQGR